MIKIQKVVRHLQDQLIYHQLIDYQQKENQSIQIEIQKDKNLLSKILETIQIQNLKTIKIYYKTVLDISTID